MNTREFSTPHAIERTLEDFLREGGNEKKLRKAWDETRDLLVAGEGISHFLVQGMAAMKLRPGVVAMTNRRLMLLSPGMLKLSFVDLPWRNLQGVHIAQSMTGAKLIFQDVHGRMLEMEHLPKKPARAACAYAQQIEDAVIEWRRQRQMEETRAAARGLVTSQHHLDPAPAPRLVPDNTPDPR